MNVSYIRVITIACTVYILHNQWFSGSQVSKIPESWKLSKTPENWQNLGISNVKLLMMSGARSVVFSQKRIQRQSTTVYPPHEWIPKKWVQQDTSESF
jgi:hypothetical protein